MAFFSGEGNKYMSARDRAVQRQRDDESRVREYSKFANEITFLGAAHGRDEAVESRRRRAEAEVLEREEKMEAMTRTAMLEARRKERQAAQEAALVQELERRKREEDSKRREIQRICESDPSLRDLQTKLTMAYVAKERFGQLKEKEAAEAAVLEAERARDAAVEEERQRALMEERRREEERRRAALAAKEELQKQQAEKEMRDFLQAEEEAARERAMVDSILAKIRAEDDAEMATKARAREETIAVIEAFKAQREKALEMQRIAEREEEIRIARYMADQAAREEHIKRAKAEDSAIREAKYRAIVEEQEALRKKQEEEDALRWLLVEAEAEKRRVEQERKRKEDSERSRREMMSANEEQRRIREKIAAEEAVREAALIQQFLEKCKEDDRKEQMARRAREEARIRYMAEIEAQRDERLALFQAQKLEEMRATEEARRQEEFRKRVIQEARRKLLEEHAAALRGFLPRGVLLSNEDLDILKAFDRNRDGKLDPEEMELAQAAFAAFDPRKGAPSAPASKATAAPPSGPAAAPMRSSTAAAPTGRATSHGGGPSGTAGLLPGGGAGNFYGARKY